MWLGSHYVTATENRVLCSSAAGTLMDPSFTQFIFTMVQCPTVTPGNPSLAGTIQLHPTINRSQHSAIRRLPLPSSSLLPMVAIETCYGIRIRLLAGKRVEEITCIQRLLHGASEPIDQRCLVLIHQSCLLHPQRRSCHCTFSVAVAHRDRHSFRIELFFWGAERKQIDSTATAHSTHSPDERLDSLAHLLFLTTLFGNWILTFLSTRFPPILHFIRLLSRLTNCAPRTRLSSPSSSRSSSRSSPALRSRRLLVVPLAS
jgi:hypothetical protein